MSTIRRVLPAPLRRRIGGVANNGNAIERRAAINILEVKAGQRIDRDAGG